MTREQYNDFCKSLPHATHVVQWGNADVWKVGGKVFAIGGWNKDDKEEPQVTFKVSDTAFQILSEQPGLRPAPYLASRGMKWIQHYKSGAMSDDDLRDYIKESHRLISHKLTKKMQRELGLNQD